MTVPSISTHSNAATWSPGHAVLIGRRAFQFATPHRDLVATQPMATQERTTITTLLGQRVVLSDHALLELFTMTPVTRPQHHFTSII